MNNKQLVIKEYDENSKVYQRFASEIERLLQRILIEENINCTAITSRLKVRDSLSEKIDRKNDKYQSLSEITDVAGVRVITYYIADVDKVADVVEREFVVDKENSIDKRESLEPDRFGYCSVHYVVGMSEERLKLRENYSFRGLKCEIQIRTVLQHAWAEIEHDLGYKSELTIPKEVKRSFSRLAGLLELGDKEFQEIRHSLTRYSLQITDKIKGNKIRDVDIDAVSLQAFIESDTEMLELNTAIRNAFGNGLREKMIPGSIESSIGELSWFGIDSIEKLQEFTQKNKEYALKIAEEKSKQRNDSKGEFDNTIAIFYLCYSELLMNNYSVEQIVQYYEDNRICENNEKRIEAAKNLIKIKKILFPIA